MVRRCAHRGWAGLAAAVVALNGCARTYDMITSERFKERPFATLFTSDDPRTVLERSEAGDERIRAMRRLKEPREHGGTAAEQDRVLAILQESATRDRRPLCRLAAIETLASFRDPRVGPILLAAYQNAAYDTPPEPGTDRRVAQAAGQGDLRRRPSSFTPDTVTAIQCRALEALGTHQHPEALGLLIKIATTPTETPRQRSEPAAATLGLESAAAASESDPIDVRLAAIRALGQYQGDRAATQALITVLRTEKDVALRGRALESLQRITGANLPPDAEAWTQWANRGGK